MCIADADRNKQGGKIFGHSIVAPESLASYEKNASVIITPAKGVTSIRQRLSQLGFSNFVFIDKHKSEQYRAEMIIREKYISEKDYWDKELETNSKIIEKVRIALADEESREIMDAFIAGRFHGDFSQTEKYITRPEYYPEGIIEFKDDNKSEVFVDCGAYDGRSAEAFVEHCPNYDYIFSFEPTRCNMN